MKLHSDVDNPSNCPLSLCILWKAPTHARAHFRIGVGTSSQRDPSPFLSSPETFLFTRERRNSRKGIRARLYLYDINDQLASIFVLMFAGYAAYRLYIVRIGPQPVIEHPAVNLTLLVNYAAAFRPCAVRYRFCHRPSARYLEQ